MQILPELNSGGVERGTVEFARELVAQGHQSQVVSAGGRQVVKLEAEGSEHFQFPVHKKSLLSLLQVKPLRALILAQQPDIVHVRSRVPAWLAWLALRKIPKAQRPALVSTFHGMYSVNGYSAVMGKGDRVIAISRAVQQYIFENYPKVNRDKVHLVHRGVDPTEFKDGFETGEQWRQDFYSQYPQCGNKKLLLMPGRLTRWKGQLDFIELLGQLRDRQRDDVHGIIVGSSEGTKTHYEDELKTRVLELQLQDYITFLGHRSDMKELYATVSAVFNLSNRPEPFGRTVTEALWSGAPVIAYDKGGPAEVLRDCFEKGLATKENLVDVTESVLAGDNAIQLQEDYLLQTQCEKTLAIYRELLADRT